MDDILLLPCELHMLALLALTFPPPRPYDLEVVPPSGAGPDHYLFSSGGVRRVTQGLPGDLLSPEDWRREAELWRSLRAIPFFRDYRLHTALRR